MNPYIIITDASGNIDAGFLAKHRTPIVPMSYSLGDDMLESTLQEKTELMQEFYNKQKKGDLTRTSQVTSFAYEEFVSPYLKQGLDVMYIALSSGLTSTVESAMVASRNLEEEYPGRKFMVLDSLAATGGIGVLLERAIKNQENGMSLEDNYKDISECTKRIRHWFLVDDLMYLKRGGRISASTAVVGTVLSIKPILKIDETGHLVNINKARGTNQAAKKLLEYYKENLDESESEGIVYISHACADQTAELIEAGVREITPHVTIRKNILCPIIGAHTGPGMAALIHLGKN